MRAGSVPVISETRSRTVPQVLSPPAPDGRVFTGINGGELASSTYRRAWDKARSTALPPAEYASPLARRVYDLRHACVSTWLNPKLRAPADAYACSDLGKRWVRPVGVLATCRCPARHPAVRG
jgi:hypothetical protein